MSDGQAIDFYGDPLRGSGGVGLRHDERERRL
jgi:hypothetical protein